MGEIELKAPLLLLLLGAMSGTNPPAQQPSVHEGSPLSPGNSTYPNVASSW
jgi:hypothetical protein